MSDELGRESIVGMVEAIRPNWTVESADVATSGTDAVYVLTVHDDRTEMAAVLKACTTIPPEDFRPEPYLCRLLRRETSIPVPEIFGAVDSHDEYPAPFYLMERCDGVRADELERTNELTSAIARDAGRFAGEYHQLADFNRFGFLRVDSDCERPRSAVTVDGRGLAVADMRQNDDGPPDRSLWQENGTETWREWLESLYRYFIADLDDRFADLQDPIEAFVEARLPTLDRSFEARLSHIDYTYWNLLVDPDTAETTAVLDWGHATAVDPYYDLVVTEHHLSERAPLNSEKRHRVREALETGYAETNTLERDDAFERRRELYLLVSYLQGLFWFSTWFADASADERADAERRYREFVTGLIE